MTLACGLEMMTNSALQSPLIWIVHTTHYRKGSDEFAHAAETLAQQKSGQPNITIKISAVKTKADFLQAIQCLPYAHTIVEFHFFGHSGMYGPMFGTVQWPEQLSPHEWKQVKMPFANDAKAYFHACRTARWFAPFFANVFEVPTYGYHGYTTVSLRPDRFVWKAFTGPDTPTFMIACPGKKSHGLLGSLRKYGGMARAEVMKEFLPSPHYHREGYDKVAELYDAAFSDIRIRANEWRWLEAQIIDIKKKTSKSKLKLLDIGCGNGSLLEALVPHVEKASGVDLSQHMIAHARKRHVKHPHFSFTKIDGPALPFKDKQFDCVVSFMSFRYLDWDPIISEIQRVLLPGGTLLVVDMVESPLGISDVPSFVRDLLKYFFHRAKPTAQRRALERLAKNIEWKTMLQSNPIRAEHEYCWYFESRFKGQRIKTLSSTLNNKVIAFNSGPIQKNKNLAMSYP